MLLPSSLSCLILERVVAGNSPGTDPDLQLFRYEYTDSGLLDVLWHFAKAGLRPRLASPTTGGLVRVGKALAICAVASIYVPGCVALILSGAGSGLMPAQHRFQRPATR